MFLFCFQYSVMSNQLLILQVCFYPRCGAFLFRFSYLNMPSMSPLYMLFSVAEKILNTAF